MASAFRNGFRAFGSSCFQTQARRVVIGGGLAQAQMVLSGKSSGVQCLQHDADRAKSYRLPRRALPSKETVIPNDGLWHEARRQTWDHHEAGEVLSLLSDVDRWHGLFPFCTHSSSVRDLGNDRAIYKVHFGMRVGWVYVGDMVEYEVRRSPGVLHLVSINGADLEYTDHIEYVFAVKDAREGGADVDVTLKIHARSRLYLAVWQSMETQLFSFIVEALKKRLLAQESLCLHS